MEILFLGSKVQMIRCSNLTEGDETFDIVFDFSWDKALELTSEDDFDVIMIDLEGIGCEDPFFDMISKSQDVSPVIFSISKDTVDKLPFEDDHHLEGSEGLKKMLLIVEDLIKEKNSIDEREDLFYSLLTHDLMNKVRLMKGSSHILKYQCDLPSRAEKRLEKMERIIDNCIELIENINTHREIVKEEPGPIDPRSSLHDVLDSKDDLLVDEGFDITVDFQECSYVVGGPLIEKVYSNILENVVKHSSGDKIIISSERTDDGLLVSIADNGKGIPEWIRKKIFEKGFTTEGEGGTGLGLFLVKKMMKVYEGKVDLKESESGGARFDLLFEYA